MTATGGLLRIWTESSVYEVDEGNKQIRRTMGLHPPSERIGVGWKPFNSIHVKVGAPAEILWRITPEGVFQMTVTSNVVAIEPEESAGQDQ